MMKNRIVLLFIVLFAIKATPAFSMDEEGITKALESNRQSLVLLESVLKKSTGTPKEHDILLRVIESLINVDKLSRQKMMAANASGTHEKRNLEFQKKIEFYSSRFIASFPKDPKVYRVYGIRAKAREETGNFAGQAQDNEAVVKLADHSSEEWLKASVKLGEAYRAKGDLVRSEAVLQDALKSASADWTVFVLESLLQTQNQSRNYERALVTLNQIISKQPNGNTAENLLVAKGQLLGKLLVDSKIGLDKYFREIASYPATIKITIFKTTLYETVSVNQEKLAFALVQHSDFRALDSQTKLINTAELAALLYDQKGHEFLLNLMTEMQTYSAIPSATAGEGKNASAIESSLKKLTELSQKIQNAISKDAKLAHQEEGKTLEALYAIIGKFNNKGESINAEAKYNRASLYLVQDRPDQAYPLFKELGKFKDSEDKFNFSFIRGLKKSKVIPLTWDFQKRSPASETPNSASTLQNLTEVSNRYCAATSFKEDLCFDSLKGLVQLGKTDTLEPLLKGIVFEPKRKDSEKEQAFSALFDFFQNSKQVSKSASLLNAAEKQGVHISHSVASDAKKTVKAQTLSSVQKMFEEGKNAEIVSYAKQFESDNDRQVFAELFAFAGLAAQRLGQDSVAQSFYEKFDQAASTSPVTDPAFADLVAIGHAIAFERAFDYSKAAYWWTKVKVWKDASQKKMALNTIWLAADMVKFKTMILTPKFCEKTDALLCDEYKKLFVATWPIYTKDFPFQKNNQPVGILDTLVQLQLQDVKHPMRLKWVMDIHGQWTTMDPVRQVALFPNFQKYAKAEIQTWSTKEVQKFKQVSTLMDFQNALKNFKPVEGTLAGFARSSWSDFQVYTDIAVGLVYEACVDALDRAKTHDQAILAQDPSIKKLFDNTTTQLVNKQKEVMNRGITHTQNFSLDLSMFEGLTQKYPEWDAVAKSALKTSPATFFGTLTGKAKFIKDQWQVAFVNFNWAKVGYCVVQFSQLAQSKAIDQNIAQTIEAETFLRFGNKIDSQRSLATLFNLAVTPFAKIGAPAGTATAVGSLESEPLITGPAPASAQPVPAPASVAPATNKGTAP